MVRLGVSIGLCCLSACKIAALYVNLLVADLFILALDSTDLPYAFVRFSVLFSHFSEKPNWTFHLARARSSWVEEEFDRIERAQNHAGRWRS